MVGYPIVAPGYEYAAILQEPDKVHPMDHPYTDRDLGTFDGQATPVIPDSVGMFTGFYDKSGNMIFEGSIVKQEFLDGEIIYSEVVYECGAFGLRELRDGCEDDEPMRFCDCGEGFTESELEVVGNVYDNKAAYSQK